MPADSAVDVQASVKTGPNVDCGLEPGMVTVDPETADGIAAAAARDANGASTETADDGIEFVQPFDKPKSKKKP